MKHNALVLAIAAALLATPTAPLLAADAATGANAQSADASDNTKPEETLVVTGTRLSSRTVSESLAPIDVLGVDEIENAGTPELQSVLARQVPSFNFPRNSITDGSDHVRPAQLRGLAPDQTLVLINGKRRHRTAVVNVNGTIGRGSSPVDLNAIPTSAIRKIEVLRDGAAAQYGSDAIAGVINVILKNDASGGNAQLRWGEYKEGDGELLQLATDIGFGIGNGGFLNLAAELRDKGYTNRSGPDGRQQYPLINGGRDPREDSFNRINHRFGDAETKDQSLFLNGELPFGNNLQLYFFGGASLREGESAGFYRRAFDARNLPSIYPDGFLPLIGSEVDDQSLVVGVRGDIGSESSWDLSYNHGNSDFDFFVRNSLNTSLGASSPRSFYAGRLSSGQQMLNFDFQTSVLPQLFYTPVNLALGAEYREESFTLSAGEPNSYFGSGAQVFPGFRPSDASDTDRHNVGLYADAETDISEVFSAGLALRYEDYSDFGSTTSGKLSARYELSDGFALRSTVSNGFRAPTLQQKMYSTTATNFIAGVPFEIRTFPVTSPVAIALGAEPLRAEESDSISLGLVAQPLPDLHFTLDFYRIDIADRIVLSENLTGTAVTNFLAAQGFAGVTGGRYFTNAIDTRTEGLDFVGRWKLDLQSAGNLSLTFAYNRNETDITFIEPNPPELQSNGLNLDRIGRIERGRTTVGAPKDKLILGADHSFGDFTTRFTATRYGEWQVLAPSAAQDDSFSADWVLDLAVSYRWNDLLFTAGFENLLDEYPDEVTTVLATDSNGFVNGVGGRDNSLGGILPYARGESPYGFNGRFQYLRVAFSW